MLVSEAHIEQISEMMAPDCRHAVLWCCYGMPRTWTPSVLQVLCILHQHLCCNTADQLYKRMLQIPNACQDRMFMAVKLQDAVQC